MRADRVVVILAKWPRTGRAKRRLAAHVGGRTATALGRSFLRDTFALASDSGADAVLVCYAPPSARTLFASYVDGARLVAQPRGTFGRRLRAALERGLAMGRRTVVIGTDSPTLPPRLVREAFARLGRAELVLGPAADGGYYLIGARRSAPDQLFTRMPWSTPAVATETALRARAAGIAVDFLPHWYDVDDRRGLRSLLADRDGLRRASATRHALIAAGLLR